MVRPGSKNRSLEAGSRPPDVSTQQPTAICCIVKADLIVQGIVDGHPRQIDLRRHPNTLAPGRRYKYNGHGLGMRKYSSGVHSSLINYPGGNRRRVVRAHGRFL